jgi:RNA-splicing ligase RtcB
MTVKKEMPTERIAQTAEKSLLKKLTDHTEVVETISEVWKDADGVVTKTHESTKSKLVKADLNAIIFVLKTQIGEKWNSDEKELNEAKLEKLKAEAEV